MLDLESVQKIYFVGIGGIAMSATAGLAKEKGFEVMGSDSKECYAPAKEVLDMHSIQYFVGYEASHVEGSKSDLFILSSGEGMENPEVAYIVANDLPRASFAELLAALYSDTLRVVVAGTHGKTTTSGLLGYLFQNIDGSSYMVGGVLQNTEQNFFDGEGHYVIFEGDEYKSQFDDPTPKFQYYKPDILVLTNLEYDHPDMFENMEALRAEFRELMANMPEDGLIVYNADDIELTRLVHESNVASASFGIENKADYKVEQVQYGSDFTTIEVLNEYSDQISTKLLGQTEEYKIQLPGKLNVYNALACIATLRRLGFSQDQIALELVSFKGIKRRFEVIGKKRGITIIDDYAHHPTAVRETLAAAKLRYPDARIWAIFEPHTFSRTKATLEDLSKSFVDADQVLISEIYPAREKAKDATITSEEVIEQVRKHHPSPESSSGQALTLPIKGRELLQTAAAVSSPLMGEAGGGDSVRLVHNKQEALDILKSEAREGDVIVVMAVGSFNRLSYELKDTL